MAHTTIKVDSTVRDRLATLAAEKGTTIAQLVSDFAVHTPTEDERAVRTARTLAVLSEMSGYTPSPEQDRTADAELARRLADVA
jgi:hypothetical protein